MTPRQTFVNKDLVDATPLDRDPFLLVEIGLPSVEGPTTEGQAERLRIDQGGGDDLGALFGGVGVGTPGPRPVLQSPQSLLVEPVNPGIDRGATDPQVPGDLARPFSPGSGQEDLGPLDEAGLFGTGRGETFQGLTFLGGQFAKRDMNECHGCTSLGAKATPLLRQTTGVSSLAGCTT
jgi:hypothetical protein